MNKCCWQFTSLKKCPECDGPIAPAHPVGPSIERVENALRARPKARRQDTGFQEWLQEDYYDGLVDFVGMRR